MPEDLTLRRPSPDTATEASIASGPRAGFWQRFLASLIDGVPFALLGYLGHRVGWTSSSIASDAVVAALSLLYFAYLEGSPSGQTVGKRMLGIRVMDFETGAPLGFGRAALRQFARGLSACALALGYLWMLWDPERRTWHDKLTDSVAVPAMDYPVERWPG